MKALSLRQPWAELILRGVKTIETRTWRSTVTGDFLIHAAKTIDTDCCERFSIDPRSLVTGSIVGRAKITSHIEYRDEKTWRADENAHCVKVALGNKPRYGYVLTEVVRFQKPFPCRGKLNFFEAKLPRKS